MLKTFRIDKPDGLYLWRLYILTTPLFGLKLHWIRKPDYDPDPHDHPWWFISLVLKGWYKEEISDLSFLPESKPFWWHNARYTLIRTVRWFNRKPARGVHRVLEVSPGGAWTLVLNGHYSRKWGFLTREGWVPYEKYLGIEK